MMPDRTGEKKMMLNGNEATIIAYRSAHDIDVQFSDGSITYHNSYSNFRRGKIGKPKAARYEEHLGERRMMNCGDEATIISYRNNKDIDVRFSDGTVIQHKRYAHFLEGRIRRPKEPQDEPLKLTEKHRASRLGEKKIMNNGLLAEITRYDSAADIDVLFENGCIATNKSYGSFVKGEIALPRGYQLGECRMMNCGMKATIIRYGAYNDIDVEFEDGYVATNKKYSSFLKGQIDNPNVEDKRLKHTREKLVGETRIMSNGQRCTIIAANGVRHIDVMFDDGTIVEDRVYDQFIRGYIVNPNVGSQIYSPDRIGEKRLMNNGQEAEIIAFRHCDDLDIKFEDGGIARNTTYSSFCKGSIANPNFRLRSNQRGEKTQDYLGYTDIRFSFRLIDGHVFYSVTTPEGVRKVMTPQMMLEEYRKRGDC